MIHFPLVTSGGTSARRRDVTGKKKRHGRDQLKEFWAWLFLLTPGGEKNLAFIWPICLSACCRLLPGWFRLTGWLSPNFFTCCLSLSPAAPSDRDSVKVRPASLLYICFNHVQVEKVLPVQKKLKQNCNRVSCRSSSKWMKSTLSQFFCKIKAMFLKS